MTTEIFPTEVNTEKEQTTKSVSGGMFYFWVINWNY